MSNPFKKVLVAKPNGIVMERRIDDPKAGIPLTPVFEPTPQNARKLLLDYFPDWERDGEIIKHDKEVLALAYTSPDGAKKIYGAHW